MNQRHQRPTRVAVRGGQGRTDQEVIEDAVGAMCALVYAIAAVVAALVAVAIGVIC